VDPRKKGWGRSAPPTPLRRPGMTVFLLSVIGEIPADAVLIPVVQQATPPPIFIIEKVSHRINSCSIFSRAPCS